MIGSQSQTNRRILVIDDNQAIHDDFRKILGGHGDEVEVLGEAETVLFGEQEASRASDDAGFQVDAAYQGEQGLERVRKALADGTPYAMAFVDVRMPPGWDGIETLARIWEADPHIQAAICTAYSDYSWDEIIGRLGHSDRLLILKKPFDTIEVRQLASALCEKWHLARQVQGKMEDLEQAVQERTREIDGQRQYLEETLARLQEAHAQLLQADKMASIGQLAAGVAHEINNPIAFVSSNLDSLGRYLDDFKRVLGAYHELAQTCREGPPPIADQARQAQAVCKEVDLDYLVSDVGNLIKESVEGTRRVRQIVADLRDFSHVENPDVAEEDVNQLIDKTINVAWNELKYKTEVIREYGQIPAIPCYGGKLGQVFLNLLVNAAHAIEERGTITIRTGQTNGQIWIEVGDTGCGIPPENMKRIFEPFFTTKEVGKGTGMGLHLAYKIVQAHGGRINADSVVGKGTTFRIELPITGPPDIQESKDEHGS